MKASNFNELKEFALQRLCDNQAEEDVIGGLLADAGQAESISEILKPEDFRNPSHALAFSASFNPS